MEFVFVWLAVSVVTGLAAQARGRSFWAWFALGFGFSVFALLAVLVMARVVTVPPAHASWAREVPAATPRAGADLVKYHAGEPIRRVASGRVSAMGREFPGVIAAERWIDEAQRGGGLAQGRADLPRVTGNGDYDQIVAGTLGCQDVLARLASVWGRQKFAVVLCPEPDNPHDASAVRVLVEDQVIGYLPRPDAAAFVDQAPQLGVGPDGARCWGVVVGDDKLRGVRLDLAWPLAR